MPVMSFMDIINEMNVGNFVSSKVPPTATVDSVEKTPARHPVRSVSMMRARTLTAEGLSACSCRRTGESRETERSQSLLAWHMAHARGQ